VNQLAPNPSLRPAPKTQEAKYHAKPQRRQEKTGKKSSEKGTILRDGRHYKAKIDGAKLEKPRLDQASLFSPLTFHPSSEPLRLCGFA
jgi:hypothetical protein